MKKRVAAGRWFRSADGALQTIQGYEAMNIIRKGQIRWLEKGNVIGRCDSLTRFLGSLGNRLPKAFAGITAKVKPFSKRLVRASAL